MVILHVTGKCHRRVRASRVQRDDLDDLPPYQQYQHHMTPTIVGAK